MLGPRSGRAAPAVAEPITHDELDRLFAGPPGLRGQLKGVQNDKIGTRLMLTGFFFVLLGGSTRRSTSSSCRPRASCR